MASSGWWAGMCCASRHRAVCSLAGGLGGRVDGDGLGGGGGRTPGVVPGAAENVGSAEVAEAAAQLYIYYI
jgi:hypothetical protein